jgi:hypothetical protein
MAVGDFINDIGLLTTTLEFRPAAGVTVVILSVLAQSNNNPRMSNGTNVAYPGAASDGEIKNIKVSVNNTNWLYIEAASGGYNAYSGVVVQ